MPTNPVERRFDLLEAEKLFNGQFHEEEEGEDEVDLTVKPKNATLYMSREESFVGKKLEHFEQ